MGDGIVDGLIVAGLEMQETMVFGAAPVAAIEHAGAQKVERSGDGPSVALCQDQHDPLGHALADAVEKVEVQVRLSPLAVGSAEVEAKEGVPMMRFEFASREDAELQSPFGGALSFLADALALA